MYDIQQLEHQWTAYNKKRKRPYYIVSISVIIVAALGSTVYFNDTLKNKFINVFSNDATVNVSVNDKNVSTVESNTSIVKLIQKPLMEVKPVKVVQTPKIIIEQEEPNPYDKASSQPILEDVESLDKPKKLNIMVQDEKSDHKKMHLDILETSSMSAYKDVEKRFYQTHDTDDSLFLAKSYFNRGEYQKAEYWALQTNKIDNTIEESWLLFAHSKAKLGQKQDAIKVLNSYIRRSNSLQAKRLLEEIK